MLFKSTPRTFRLFNLLGGLFARVTHLNFIRGSLGYSKAFMLRLKTFLKTFPYRWHILLLVLIILGAFDQIWNPGPLIQYLVTCSPDCQLF